MFLWMATAVALVAGVACSQDEDLAVVEREEKQQEALAEQIQEEAFAELRENIAALNAKFGIDVSRANSNGNEIGKKVKDVVVADIAGAMGGANAPGKLKTFVKMLLHGVRASIDKALEIEKSAASNPDMVVYRPVKSVNHNLNTFYPEGFPENPTLLDSIGFAHNEIICDLYAFYGDRLVTLDETNLDLAVRRQVATYANDSGALTAPQLDDEFRFVLQNLNNVNIEQSFARMAELRPQLANELVIVKEYSLALAQLGSDAEVIAYTQQHNGLLSVSNIVDTSKKFIQGVTLVGGNSALMWMPVTSPAPVNPVQP